MDQEETLVDVPPTLKSEELSTTTAASTNDDDDDKAPPPPPVEEVSYPITVIYCGNCGLPPEVHIII